VWKTALGRVRVIGFAEGASFLLLMGVAMPLKYFAGFPEAVQVVGMAHGILFIVYLIAIAWALVVGQLTFVFAFFGVIASILPAGPFVYDYFLPKPKVAESAPDL